MRRADVGRRRPGARGSHRHLPARATRVERGCARAAVRQLGPRAGRRARRRRPIRDLGGDAARRGRISTSAVRGAGVRRARGRGDPAEPRGGHRSSTGRAGHDHGLRGPRAGRRAQRRRAFREALRCARCARQARAPRCASGRPTTRRRTARCSSSARAPGAEVDAGAASCSCVGRFARAAARRAAAGHAPRGNAVRVAVLAGGRSSEHDVSLASGAAVRAGLDGAGHEPVAVEISPRRALDARRRAGLARARRRAARLRRRVPGPARPLRRGRHRPGRARGARHPLLRRRRPGVGGLHGQGAVQGR